jgi:uncharacterized membrane protein
MHAISRASRIVIMVLVPFFASLVSLPTSVRAQYDFHVAGVRANDVLHMRDEPDGSRVLKNIPHNADLVAATGATVSISKSRWYEVYYDGTKGWVNGKFLENRPESTHLTNLNYDCFGREPLWSLELGRTTAVYQIGSENYSYSVASKDLTEKLRRVYYALASLEQPAMTVLITNREWCSVGVSERDYAFDIVINGGPQSYENVKGCCTIRREP